MITSPAEKLAELCDADRRKTDLSTQAVATAITAPGPDAPMPDPHRDRDRHQSYIDSIRALLQQEPSEQAVRATGRRLVAELSSLVDRIAKETR